MMDTYQGIPVIDDSTPLDDAGGTEHGLIPRDYNQYPQGFYCPSYDAVEMPLIDKSEWSDRIKEREATKSRTSDILAVANNGQPIKALYQDGWGYCWSYSCGHAVTAVRAIQDPSRKNYVELSPFAVAHIIKGGANQGGWCGLSLDFVMKYGIPSVQTWPNLKAGLSQDNSAMREDAAKYKITEGWVDLAAAVYDRNVTFNQLATLLLSGVPCQVDFNWWSHSVCALDLVETEPGSFDILILNSHGTDYRSQLMVLKGNRARPDGGVAPRVAMAA